MCLTISIVLQSCINNIVFWIHCDVSTEFLLIFNEIILQTSYEIHDIVYQFMFAFPHEQKR